MTPPGSNTVSQVALDLAEIKGQLGQLSEIKITLEALSKSMIGFREEYVREHAILQASADKAHTRIDNVYKEIDEIKCSLDEIKKMMPILKLIGWAVGGMLVPLLVGAMLWVWTLITHGGLVLP